MVGWPCCFGAESAGEHGGRSLWLEKLVVSWPLGSKERKEGANPTVPFQGVPQ